MGSPFLFETLPVILTCAPASRVIKASKNRMYYQAGAGIVADSVPANEWDETMNKGRAIFRAVAMACRGLKGRH